MRFGIRRSIAHDGREFAPTAEPRSPRKMGPIVCEGCGTAHHADCYAENQGCTIFGCSKAPGDEPKMQRFQS